MDQATTDQRAAQYDTVMVFPGMGPTRFADLARFLVVDRRARELLEVADGVLGYSLIDRCRQDAADEDGDDYSEHRQVLFLVTCLAMARWAQDVEGARPGLCTGPSFGVKGAAVFSGTLDTEAGVRLTVDLARCEADYFVGDKADLVTASFVRAPQDVLEELTGQLTAWAEPHEVSCHIDDDFWMLTLPVRRLEWLQQQLRARGAMPLYSMRPPMHASMFEPLRDRVEHDVLRSLTFADPHIPVVADQDGTVLTTGAQVRQLMLDGIVRAVRWPAVVDSLLAHGVRRVYIAGPDAIFGRVRRTTAAFETVGLHPRTALRPRPRASLPVPVAG